MVFAGTLNYKTNVSPPKEIVLIQYSGHLNGTFASHQAFYGVKNEVVQYDIAYRYEFMLLGTLLTYEI